MNFAQPVDADHSTLTTIKQVIVDASARAPRSLQTGIGPSEVGAACARKLAYRLLDIPATNTATDPLPSAVGTGAHAWIADAFEADNKRLGRVRWLTETRVQCGVVAGSCDLLDTDTGTVIDHKFPGATAMRKAKTDGPSDQYRVQAHLYGLGHSAAGRLVKRVAIVFYPRGGMLTDAHIWSQPYNATIARDALARLESIAAGIDAWMGATGGDKNATLAAIAPTPSPLCNWCPALNRCADDLSQGCPGETPK